MQEHRYFNRALLVQAARRRRLQSQSHAHLGDFIFAGVVVCLLAGWFVYTEIHINPFKHRTQAVQAQSIKNDLALNSDILATPTPTPTIKPITDSRAKVLYDYLKQNKSPLADYSQIIVEEADRWDIGWTKVVALSKIESSFGTTCPQNSHNAWGIGKPFEYYASWEEGIKRVSKLLGEHYKSNEYAGIKAKYCPASDGCNPNWTSIATNTSNDILELAKAN